MVGNVWEWMADLDVPASDVSTTDSAIARQLGEAFDGAANSPSTKSMLTLDGTGTGDSGPNTSGATTGFRCVR